MLVLVITVLEFEDDLGFLSVCQSACVVILARCVSSFKYGFGKSTHKSDII